MTASLVVHLIGLAVLVLAWIIFTLGFLLRKRPPAIEQHRDRRSTAGVVLQGFGYAIAWQHPRPIGTTTVYSLPVEILVTLLAAALCAGSLWLALGALRALGKQWSITARVLEDHQLITGGPFRYVRHPIYAAMWGLLLALGLVWSRWPLLLAGAVIFGIGTAIRIRSEEALLRAPFGAAYDDYARRVPALIPGLAPGSRRDDA